MHSNIFFTPCTLVYLQTNDVFESSKPDKTSEPLHEKSVEQVSDTPQDVAVANSEQALVSTKEKSTKDKVSVCVRLRLYLNTKERKYL